MSLRQKLMLAFLTVTVLPFGALVVGLRGPAIRQAESVVGGRLKDNVELSARAIDQFMINCIRDMRAFSADASAYTGQRDPSKFLDRLTYFYPYFREFSFADPRGQVLGSSDPTMLEKSLFELYPPVQADFQSAVSGPQGAVLVTPLLHQGPEENEFRLQLLAPVHDDSGACIGVLSGYLVMEHLMDLLADMDERLPGDRASALLDSHGHIMMSNEPAARWPHTEGDLRQLNDEIGHPKKGGYSTYAETDGHRVMSGYAHLWTYGSNRVGDWRLVATAPYEVIMSPVQVAMMKGSSILLGAIAAAFIIAYWLARTLAKPIWLLTEGARKIAGGDFATRVEVRARDETGELANSFNQMAGTIQQQIAELNDANLNLEARVEERTSALLEAQSQLAETSRQAGMAEVATSVLHNVGNVLNSVNVTAALVSERLRKSKAANIGKAARLMEDNRENLGGFMTDDPRGRQLPGYLTGLASHLEGEQAFLTDELRQLQKNVEHIKDIVNMQQNYAKVYGVSEVLTAQSLAEDALQLNTSALLRHEVEVVRDYGEVPPFSSERHKVLQILVNLIRNAKHACDDGAKASKQIRLQTRQEEGFVVIRVADNGIGIRPENMDRIFSHGFTTRAKGHGFGLHNSALAAKNLGGSLTAESPGHGQGATFTLRLPLPPAP
jgi:signal transduction histidine kinase